MAKSFATASRIRMDVLTTPVAATVPCNGCTACCKRENVFLLPEHGDDIASYDAEEAISPFNGKMAMRLKHKPNGDCVYLGDNGCAIYGRAPAMCKVFDCRRAYKDFMQLPRNERRTLIAKKALDPAVLDAGKQRMETLK